MKAIIGRFPAVLIPLTRGATGIKGEELPFGWSVNEICFWDQRGAFNGTNALPGLTRQALIPSIPSSLSLSLYHYTSAVATTWYLSAFSIHGTLTRIRATLCIRQYVPVTTMYVFTFLTHAYAVLFFCVYTVGRKFRIICFFIACFRMHWMKVLFRIQRLVSYKYREEERVDKHVNWKSFTINTVVLDHIW